MEWDLSLSYFQLLLILPIVVISWFYLQKRSKKTKKLQLTEEEKDELIKAWKPEPLVPPTKTDHPVLNPKYVDGKMTKKVTIEGKEYLNLSTTNYLSFVGDKRIEEVAKKTIFKYGVGSCGPRGFYGTVDVHLDLEADIAKFLGCEESVLYSYGYATVASAIPAYAKKGDVIFVDKGANYAIQKGCIASRARLEWFEHNDMDDLERLLEEQAAKDKKNPSTAGKIRRFIIVEGLYANSGNICPLARIVDFKWKYKTRIFIDESYSFGVLGKTGKGVTEHYDIPVADIDMVMGSLEHSIASTGGFCVGRSYVVGHQRLAGLGYCFSASLPPLLATAANEALRIMQTEPERLSRTKELALAAHSGLEAALENTPFYVYGFNENPMKHIGYKGPKEEAEKKLDALVDKLFDEHEVMITRARYLEEDELFDINPSARFIVQYGLLDSELETALDAVKTVVHQM